MTYNLETVRKLLNDAFSSGEIKTLAFDRFYEVHNDFAAGMAKRQMIEAVVEYAHKNGRIPDLLDYVKKANPYQYERYAPQLAAAPPARHPAFGDEQRLQDLQSNIDREAKLLNEYEKQLTYEDDSRKLLKIQHNIERQKETIAGYRHEAAQIQAALSAASVPDTDAVQNQLADINQQLSAISQQIDKAETRLADGQKAIREDIRQQQETVLAHIDAQHRQTIAVLVNKMDANQLELTELMLDAADKQQIAQWQADQLTMLTQQALLDLKQLRHNQPDAAQWDSLLDALASQTGWQQKLKLTVPLIPGILEFETEMAMDVVPALKQAWGIVVKKVRAMRG